MNMRTALSDDQLLAQRQARTGRTVATVPGNGAPPEPGLARPAADPGGARPTAPQRDPFGNPFGGASGGTEDIAPAPVPAAPQGFDAQAAFNAMQQQLDAALGRVAPLQQQLEQYRSTAETLQASNAALQAKLMEVQDATTKRAAQEAAASFDPFEGMSADELAMIDPAVISAMRRSAQAALAKATVQVGDPRALIAQTLQERDTRQLKAFQQSVSEELQLLQLGSDPKFQQFLSTDDSADMLLNSFAQATDIDAAQKLATRVRTMLKRYRAAAPGASASAGNNTPDPQDRLSAHMSRSGNQSAAPGANGQTRNVLTPEQVKDIRRQAQALTRQRRFKDAQALLDKLS